MTPNHRWHRFSIQRLLVLVAIVACLLAWVTKERRESKTQHDLVQKLPEGARSVQFCGPFGTLELPGAAGKGKWWRDLRRSILGDRVYGISASCNRFKPLPRMDCLTELGWLSLNGHITDSDLKAITGLKKVKHLQLIGAMVSNLNPLAGLETLEHLSLNLTSPQDLTPLAKLRKLKALDVSGAQVTDLSPLTELDSLEQLTVDEFVAEEQVQMLSRALPDCTIKRQ